MRTASSSIQSRRASMEFRIVIPVNMRQKIMAQCHNHPLSGHLGVKRTYARLATRYFWFGMYESVQEWINMCIHCATRKGSPKDNAYNTTSIPVSSAWEVVGTDIMGPLPKTKNGHRYIITFTDHMTKWVEAIPLKETSAETIAEVYVKQIICRHGTPLQLLSDRGTNFMSKVLAKVNETLQVKHKRTSPYHPRTNGLTERFNKTLADMLTMYTSSHQRDWDEHLPFVMFAYLTSVHSSTKESPFFLMHGRDARMPTDFILPSEGDIVTVEEYKYDMMENLQQAYKEVTYYTSKLIQDREQRLNARKQEHEFKEGQLVWVYTYSRKVGYSNKFKRPWQGPFRIWKLLSPVTAKLHYLPGKPLKAVINVARLKKYIDPMVPTEDIEVEDDLQEQDLVEETIVDLTKSATVQPTQDKNDNNSREIKRKEAPIQKENIKKKKRIIVGNEDDNEDNKEEELEMEYEVQDILDVRIRKGETEYKVLWKSYDIDEATWEKAERCGNATKKIEKFHEENGLMCSQCKYLVATKSALEKHKRSHK
jgi:hypothetical protein